MGYNQNLLGWGIPFAHFTIVGGMGWVVRLVWDALWFAWGVIRVVLGVLWFVLGALGLLLGGIRFLLGNMSDALGNVLHVGWIFVYIGCNLVYIGCSLVFWLLFGVYWVKFYVDFSFIGMVISYVVWFWYLWHKQTLWPSVTLCILHSRSYYTSSKSYPREIPPMKFFSTYPRQELTPREFFSNPPEIRQFILGGWLSN